MVLDRVTKLVLIDFFEKSKLQSVIFDKFRVIGLIMINNLLTNFVLLTFHAV